MKYFREISLLAASSMTVMAGAAISPALPEIKAFFANEPDADFWAKIVLTLPALFIALGAPLAGWLVDRWLRKPVLLGSVFLYGVAGSSGLYAPTLNTLLLGRAALGLAVAGIMTGATTLVADYFTGEARNRFLGFQSAAMSLGGVVFVLLGGFLTDTGWRAPFAVYLLAFLLLPILWLALEEPLRPDKTTNTDLSAAARWPWGLLLLLYSLMLFCQVIFYLIPAQLPFHLRDLFRASGVQAGMAMGLFNFCAAVAALNYKRLKEKANYQMLFALLFSLVGLGYLLLSGATAYWQTLCSLVIAGLGFGLLIPNTNTWLLAQTPESLRGRAIGGLTTAIFLGQFLSPVLASPRGPVKTLNAVYALAGIVAAFFALCFAALRCRA